MSLVFVSSFAYSASKTLLVLGDSLSAEYGLVRGSGWVSLLEKRIKEENLPVTVVNASISGETTSGGRARLPALLDKHRPDLVIIELGGNDGLRGLPVKSAEANLRAMITASQQANARVLLAGMQIPPNYGREYTQQFFGMYRKLAQETRAALVPFLLEGVADRVDLFQADRIHPTAQAQPVILDNIWPVLKGMLRAPK
ncbi:arylesterase [Noviherbaspirillum aridicola]|uniref:Arylesterase n=1 Tax=Noviherbaspirillum aridicola TaxID=2849687 RepID=A0ABQ4Q3B5_9BURK|nr:arylesterase [Noviherbaspirillum aridicola]